MFPNITARRFFVTGFILIFLFVAFGPKGYYDIEDESDLSNYKAAVKRHKHTQLHIDERKRNKRNRKGPLSNEEKILNKFEKELSRHKVVTTKPNKFPDPRPLPKRKPPVVIESGSGDAANAANVIVHDISASEDESSSVGNKQVLDEDGNPLPFPVYESMDKGVPEETSKIASEKLECRASVIEFVINATDVKDECEGLRKAFDASCTIGDTSEAGSSSVFSSQTGRRAVRRRLEAAGINVDTPSDGSVLLGHAKIIFYRALFSIQDKVGAHLETAYDNLFVGQRKMQERTPPLAVAGEETLIDEEGAQLKPGEGDDVLKVPEKTTPGKAEHSTGISIPTSSHRIGDHVFTDTLLFQEGPIGLAAEKNPSSVDESEKEGGGAASDTNAPRNAAFQKSQPEVANANEKSASSPLVFTPEAEELKTCCSSIMNVYHEHCDKQDDDELNDRKLILIVSVIALCSLVKSLIRHFEIRWLPEAAGCILVGVFGGMVIETMPHLDVGFDEKLFLRVMLPPIVFEAALNIDKRSFQRHAFPILLYAILGTILSATITAFIVYKGSSMTSNCVSIPFIESLLFGALISSIDPIAVLSILSNMGMRDTDTIYVLIFGESLLNDGVAIVLFDTLIHFLDESLVLDGGAIWDATTHFLVVAMGSIFFGVLSGVCCTSYFWAMHGCQSPLVEVMAFVCWSLIPYYICDNIRWSGIVAIVAAGMVMDIYVVGSDHKRSRGQSEHNPIFRNDSSISERDRSRRKTRAIFNKEGHMSTTARTHIGFVTEIISTLMETAIFAYLGLFLFNARYHWSFHLSTIAILSCILSRGLVIPTLSFVANTVEKVRRQSRKGNREQANGSSMTNKTESELSNIIIDKRMQLVLLFAGLRGAVSFALVENVPLYDSTSGHGSRLKPELKAMTSASIMFTVFVLGGSTYYLLEKLGISLNKESAASMEMINLLHRKTSDAEAMSDTESSTTDSEMQNVRRTASPSSFR